MRNDVSLLYYMQEPCDQHNFTILRLILHTLLIVLELRCAYGAYVVVPSVRSTRLLWLRIYKLDGVVLIGSPITIRTTQLVIT